MPNIEEVRLYQTRVLEAIDQLESTSKRTETTKPKVHVALLFDQVYAIDGVFKIGDLTTLPNIFFLSISEFEEIVALNRTSELLFEQKLSDMVVPKPIISFDDPEAKKGSNLKIGFSATILHHFEKLMPRNR